MLVIGELLFVAKREFAAELEFWELPWYNWSHGKP